MLGILNFRHQVRNQAKYGKKKEKESDGKIG
jgi:hypothetical protein